MKWGMCAGTLRVSLPKVRWKMAFTNRSESPKVSNRRRIEPTALDARCFSSSCIASCCSSGYGSVAEAAVVWNGCRERLEEAAGVNAASRRSRGRFSPILSSQGYTGWLYRPCASSSSRRSRSSSRKMAVARRTRSSHRSFCFLFLTTSAARSRVGVQSIESRATGASLSVTGITTRPLRGNAVAAAAAAETGRLTGREDEARYVGRASTSTAREATSPGTVEAADTEVSSTVAWAGTYVAYLTAPAPAPAPAPPEVAGVAGVAEACVGS